eukprot:619385-Rhodomonas_salina.4
MGRGAWSVGCQAAPSLPSTSLPAAQHCPSSLPRPPRPSPSAFSLLSRCPSPPSKLPPALPLSTAANALPLSPLALQAP